MQETEQREITLSKIFRALLRKFYIILIAVFVAAIVGGIFGYVQNKGNDLYGATSKFKIAVVSQVQGSQETQSKNHTYDERLLSMITDEMSYASFVKDNIIPELANSYKIPPYDENDLGNGFFEIVALVQSSISYSYDHQRNTNAISVSVVSTDKPFAEALLKCVKIVVPAYIEANMTRPEDVISYDNQGNIVVIKTYSTRCTEMTLSRVKLLNPGQENTGMVKNAVIFAFGAAVIAAIVIIIADNADTRVRDHEKLAETIGVPVLAAIPKLQDVKTTHSPILTEDANSESTEE